MSEGIARTSGEVGKKEKTGVYIQRSEEYYDRAEVITKTTAASPTIRAAHRSRGPSSADDPCVKYAARTHGGTKRKAMSESDLAQGPGAN